MCGVNDARRQPVIITVLMMIIFNNASGSLHILKFKISQP